MKVFISWSGEVSKNIALAIRDWLPNVIQFIEPWMSADDIRSGQRWSLELANVLEEANYGIICLTQDNIDKPWLNFEAGSLSKSISNGKVVPLLFDLQPTDLIGPLGQFQSQTCTREGIQAIIESLYETIESPPTSLKVVLKSFDAFWPELENKFKELRKQHLGEMESIRTDRDLLEELLTTVRNIGRTIPERAKGGQQAVGVQVIWFDDLVLAAQTLFDDLDFREYQFERNRNDPRFMHNEDMYERIQKEWELTKKSVEYMNELRKNNPPLLSMDKGQETKP